jgi:hypothetical protein
VCVFFSGRVQISNDGKEVVSYIDMNSNYKSKNSSFGSGVIGHQALVITSLGLTKVRKDRYAMHRVLFSIFVFNTLFIELLMQGSTFKMKYNGYSMRSLSVHKREKVYNLQIVNIGAKGSDPTAPDWAAEAEKQPLVPAQLPDGVLPRFSLKFSEKTSYLRLKAEQHKIFMDQIGQPYKHRGDLL